MKISSWGGMTREEHDAIQHTSAMIADGAITLSKLGVLFGKYYEKPSGSSLCFYTTLQKLNLSLIEGNFIFFSTYDLPAEVITLSNKKIAGGAAANEANIYDNNYDSSAKFTGISTYITWDLETIGTRWIMGRFHGGGSAEGSAVQISNDNSTYTTLVSSNEELHFLKSASFRYLKFVNRNGNYNAYLHCLRIVSPISDTTITAEENKKYCLLGDWDSITKWFECYYR